MKKKSILFGFVLFISLFMLWHTDVNAEELTALIDTPIGGLKALTDNANTTFVEFKAGDEIKVTAKDESKIKAVYIIWNNNVEPYKIKTDSEELDCGENRFLHEYILLDKPSEYATICIPEKGAAICGIRIFSDENVPHDVQIWEPTPEKCDIMIYSSHADDEILFFGSFITPYVCETDAEVVVAYMTEFWTSLPVREHEKLDGLWTAGLRNYPICGNFKDVYSNSLEQARTQYDSDAMVDFVKTSIDTYEPQVIVTHDFNGEYGHGYHMLTNEAVIKAVDEAEFKVPKTYIHLYPENEIFIDVRTPISSMGGRTALEVLKEAYKKHETQQWCWFYVDDEYEYSLSRFGLYKTTVGVDTEDDVLCNIKTYATQEAEKKAEEERIKLEEQAKEEAEKAKAEEARLEELAQSEAAKHKRDGIATAAVIFIIFLMIYVTAKAIGKKRRK